MSSKSDVQTMQAAQGRLWTLDCIPKLHSDETLYSWCALYHRISGTAIAETTSRRLFNSATGGFVRDFPGRLDYFVHVTDGGLGDAGKIIDGHTLFRLYSKFRPAETMNKVRGMMRGASVERVKSTLGLPSSRANSYHPLKFCRECAKEEVDAQGFARWWIYNQWPTVWICARHGRQLDWALDGTAGLAKKTWILPSDLTLDQVVSAPLLSSNTREILKALARLTVFITNHDEQHYSPQVLSLVFLSQIRARGWVSAHGTIRYGSIRDALLSNEELSQLPGMDFIQSLVQEDYGFLGRAVRGRGGYLHPSKYLLLINSLFDDPSSFSVSYDKFSEVSDFEGARMQILDPARMQREEKLRTMISIEKRPLNQAAQAVNMSIAGVVAWAKRSGVDHERRPRLENVRLLADLKRLIEMGMGRDEMAVKLGVRRRWLTAFFTRHADLRREWQCHNRSAVIESRRAAFKVFLEQHRGVPLGRLLLIPSNGYKWLLKHDRQWLADNMPQLRSCSN